MPILADAAAMLRGMALALAGGFFVIGGYTVLMGHFDGLRRRPPPMWLEDNRMPVGVAALLIGALLLFEAWQAGLSLLF